MKKEDVRLYRPRISANHHESGIQFNITHLPSTLSYTIHTVNKTCMDRMICVIVNTVIKKSNDLKGD